MSDIPEYDPTKDDMGAAGGIAEHCTGIARSWVRIPFKPEFFFRLLFQLLGLRAHCEDQVSLMFHPQFTYVIFIYSYSYLSLSSGISQTHN